MPQLLLINPRARNMAKKARTAAQKRATARMIAANRARRGGGARRANPIAKRRARSGATSPVAVYSRKLRRSASRRRRNPISLRSLTGGAGGSYMAMFKDAAIGGAGAVAFDLLHGQVAGFLPASLRRTPGTVGVGDAVKAVLTAFIGQLASKPTRGLSAKMARGSLTVQARDLIATMVPATMPLGYYTAAPITNGTMRVGPNRRMFNNQPISLTPSGPLLNRYVSGASPLLNGRDAQMREGVSMYR